MPMWNMGQYDADLQTWMDAVATVDKPLLVIPMAAFWDRPKDILHALVERVSSTSGRLTSPQPSALCCSAQAPKSNTRRCTQGPE